MRWLWRDDHEPGDPWFNMAEDIALFDAVRDEKTNISTVRIYRWDRPCVSIGRLQDAETIRGVYPHLPLVRRPTGGRAVVHDDDLSISVVTRTTWLPQAGSGVLASYRQIAAGVLCAWRALGVSAVLGSQANQRGSQSALNCFETVASCDVTNAETRRKLMGCAQRREKEFLLQQMTIPAEFLTDPPQFLVHLQGCFAASLGIDGWATG